MEVIIKMILSKQSPGSIEDYQLGEFLGKGGFGFVFAGVEKSTGTKVAVKKVRFGVFQDLLFYFIAFWNIVLIKKSVGQRLAPSHQ